jgi:hypothetical protein
VSVGVTAMKRLNLIMLGLLCVVAPPPPAEPAEPEILVLSVATATDVGGLRVVDRQPVCLRLDRSLWFFSNELSALLPEAVDVDALSVTTGGAMIVSTDVGFLLHGQRVADEDLLLLEDGVLSVLFDGSAHGLPEAADIDAVHVVALDPLEFYYSVSTPTDIGGVVYQDDDIIRWAAGAHSLAVSGADLFGSQRARLDVDGLCVDPDDGDLLLSTDVGFRDIGAVTEALDDDVLHYHLATGTLSLFAELSSHGLESARVDIDALGDAGPHVFADGFESGDTSRWSLTIP